MEKDLDVISKKQLRIEYDNLPNQNNVKFWAKILILISHNRVIYKQD